MDDHYASSLERLNHISQATDKILKFCLHTSEEEFIDKIIDEY